MKFVVRQPLPDLVKAFWVLLGPFSTDFGLSDCIYRTFGAFL